MKLVVILPAYNAENFITECLDSLLNQTFSDFCILAVDDASTDSTGNILESYAAKDTRLRVYHFFWKPRWTCRNAIHYGYA